MSKDWYDEGYQYVLDQISLTGDCTLGQAEDIYKTLREIGLIDYDVEKEIFYDIVYPEGEDD